MLQDLVNSADCLVGPSGVNPLKALADAVDGSAFNLEQPHNGGASSSVADAALGSGAVLPEAYSQHADFSRQFAAHGAAAQQPPLHPSLERAWAQNALRKAPMTSDASGLETAWADAARCAAASRAPPAPTAPPLHQQQQQHYALAPGALADRNPAVIECFRALAHADGSLPLQHARALAAGMARSLPPAERQKAAIRLSTQLRLALGARADAPAAQAQLAALLDELGAQHLAHQPPSAERAQTESWIAEFQSQGGGGSALVQQQAGGGSAWAMGAQQQLGAPSMLGGGHAMAAPFAPPSLYPQAQSLYTGGGWAPQPNLGAGSALAASFWAARDQTARQQAAEHRPSLTAVEGGRQEEEGGAAGATLATSAGDGASTSRTADAHASELNLASASDSASVSASASASASADTRSAARELTRPMIDALEQAGGTDTRFRDSQLLEFLRKVHEGAISLDDGGGGVAVQGVGGMAAQGDGGPAAQQQLGTGSVTHASLSAAIPQGAATAEAAGGVASAEGRAGASRAEQERAWAHAVSGDLADETLFEGLWDSLRLDGSTPYPSASASASAAAAAAGAGAFGDAGAMAAALKRGAGGGAGARAPDPYPFAAANPYARDAEPLVRARELVTQGRLAEAVSAAEAAVEQSGRKDSKAWQLLGQLHADCDNDGLAITALGHALAADANNGAARLLLGVSCTNELDQPMALHHLRQWLQLHPNPSLAALAADAAAQHSMAASLHPSYDPMADPASREPATRGPAEWLDPFTEHDQLTSLFRAAARDAPHDADVHAVLGVLYNLSLEYDEAIRSFQKALELRPDDYSLWNKLGATCANAMRPAQALSQYVRALELRPDYVRALTNLGIAYGNLNQPMEGAACYLRALELNPSGVHIWGYLTMLFHMAGQHELAERAASRDVEAYRGLVDF
jgi:tetratricopeptide (TPR) repeat protein